MNPKLVELKSLLEVVRMRLESGPDGSHDWGVIASQLGQAYRLAVKERDNAKQRELKRI